MRQKQGHKGWQEEFGRETEEKCELFCLIIIIEEQSWQERGQSLWKEI